MNTGNDIIGTLDVLHVRPLSEMGKAEVSRRHHLGLLKVGGSARVRSGILERRGGG
jgi:hypothetical protein